MDNTKQSPILSSICSNPFFKNFDEDTLLHISSSAKLIYQPRNTIIFNEGESCHGFYIVKAGAVKVYNESSDAKEHVLHIATMGDCFGEAALFLGMGYPASAASVQDSTLILLRKNEFLQLLRENSDICFRLMASMANWAHRLVESIESLTLKDAGARFASYILSLVNKEQCDGIIISFGMPKNVLASHLGITSETLSRLIARFEANNIIETHGKSLKIISYKQLYSIADIPLV